MLKLHLYANIIKYLLIFAAVYINNYINWLYFYIRFIRERNIYLFNHARNRALLISLMKFFTYLAAAMLSLSSISAFAQDADNELKGDLKFENVVMGGYNQASTPMAITSEGNIVVTGTTANMATGAISAYIAMSSKDMPSTPIWKIDLDGRSIVTSIISDGNGGVFVGGNFRSAIYFKDINGNEIALSGNFDVEDYSGAKLNTFIAHINKDGKTLAAKAFTSTPNPEVTSQNPYYNVYSAYCNLNNLVYFGGKLYAGLSFQDIISDGNEDKQLKSPVYNYWGSVGSSGCYTIAQINPETLGIVDYPVLFGGDTSDESFSGLDVKSAKIATDGKYLYLAANPNGWSSKVALELNGQVVDRASFHYVGALNGFYIASIDLANNKLVTSKSFDGEYSYSDANFVPAMGDLLVNGEDLLVSGTYIQNCPFDKSIKVVGNTDLFAVCLNKSDLSAKSVLTSKYDETAANGDQEVFSSLVASNNMLSVSGYVANSNSIKSPLLFNVDDYSSTDAVFENEAEADEDYITGAVVADGKTVYTAFLSNDQKSYFYHYATQDPTGVKTIEAATVSKDDAIYNLQGMKLRAPQKGLNIVNGKKVFVK